MVYFAQLAKSLAPDIPQSKTPLTYFYDSGGGLAKNWVKFSGHFRASFAVQNDPPKFLLKLQISLDLRLVAENPNFIPASFWGFGAQKVSLPSSSCQIHAETQFGNILTLPSLQHTCRHANFPEGPTIKKI